MLVTAAKQISYCYTCTAIIRLLDEVDEVLGDKDTVSAEDIEKLQYTEQVSYNAPLLLVYSVIITLLLWTLLCTYIAWTISSHIQCVLEGLRMYPPITGSHKTSK